MKKIAVSACLLGRNCKYNGGNNFSPRLAALLEGRQVIPICPEEHLGTPRAPMELVDGVLMNRDGTVMDKTVRSAVAEVLQALRQEDVELCILQSRSPTCGVNQIYDGSFSGRLVTGMGVLAEALHKAGFRVVDVEDL